MAVIRTLSVGLWLVLSCWAVNATANKAGAFAARYQTILSTPPLVNLRPEIVSVIMLGHRGIYDDMINIWALQFLANPALTKLPVQEVFDTVKKITGQFPKIESLYMISCFVIGLDMKAPELCKPISLDGLRAFPDSWRIPMTQGFIHEFKLGEHAQAAVFFQLAATRPNSPPYVARLAKKLTEKEDISPEDIKQGLALLKEVPGGSKLEINFDKHESDTNGEGQ